MREIFVIYNKTTGLIDGGSGRIDRGKDAARMDGSTMLERISDILKKNPDRTVVYLKPEDLPDGQLPARERCKIVKKRITPLDQTDHDKHSKQALENGLISLKTQVDAAAALNLPECQSELQARLQSLQDQYDALP